MFGTMCIVVCLIFSMVFFCSAASSMPAVHQACQLCCAIVSFPVLLVQSCTSKYISLLCIMPCCLAGRVVQPELLCLAWSRCLHTGEVVPSLLSSIDTLATICMCGFLEFLEFLFSQWPVVCCCQFMQNGLLPIGAVLQSIVSLYSALLSRVCVHL